MAASRFFKVAKRKRPRLQGPQSSSMHVRNYAVALYLVPRQAPAGRALRRLTDRFSLFGCGERKRAVIDLFARDFRLRARTIIVETANRFARDLMVQEVGFAMLRDLGITLIAADSPTSFLDDGPTSKLIRQI